MDQSRPLEPRQLPADLTDKLDDFLAQHDFPCLYRSYNWKNDTHSAEFPDIFRLEVKFQRRSSKPKGITLEDIKCVGQWGGDDPEDVKKIKIRDSNSFHRTARKLHELQTAKKPALTTACLDDLGYSVAGIGPVYGSKVLRFAWPAQYGAIDRRLVGLFGKEAVSNCHRWLPLRVGNMQTLRLAWTDAYPKWVDILRYFAQRLSDKCPHPQQFVDAGLRDRDVWTCADVEMALFAYASNVLRDARAKNPHG